MTLADYLVAWVADRPDWQNRPLDNRAGGLNMDSIGPGELLLERAIAVPLHKLGPLLVRWASLSLLGAARRGPLSG